MEKKTIFLSLPNNLLEEVDYLAAVRRSTREEVVLDAIRLYLYEQNRRDVREKLKRGYEAMAELNRSLAEEVLLVENESWPLVILEGNSKKEG